LTFSNKNINLNGMKILKFILLISLISCDGVSYQEQDYDVLSKDSYGVAEFISSELKSFSVYIHFMCVDRACYKEIDPEDCTKFYKELPAFSKINKKNIKIFIESNELKACTIEPDVVIEKCTSIEYNVPSEGYDIKKCITLADEQETILIINKIFEKYNFLSVLDSREITQTAINVLQENNIADKILRELLDFKNFSDLKVIGNQLATNGRAVNFLLLHFLQNGIYYHSNALITTYPTSCSNICTEMDINFLLKE
jgi:hypothetical protein